MLDWPRLLPKAGARYTGPRPPFYFLILIAVAGTIRSLVHMLAHDGGAGSIAGLALDGGRGTNIAAIFAQWGASQLLLALFYWVAILRTVLNASHASCGFHRAGLASHCWQSETVGGCRRAARRHRHLRAPAGRACDVHLEPLERKTGQRAYDMNSTSLICL